jgi:dienelactone hydrolase
MNVMAALCLAGAVLAIAPAAAAAGGPEKVRITGGAVVLPGLLYKPPGAGPFPAVVAMHGCGGLFGKASAPEARHDSWGRHLADQGFVVLFPDSFGPRGLGSQCRVRDRQISAAGRVVDAVAARRWLEKQAFVKPGAVSLLGWSNGGTTVLHAAQEAQAGEADAAGFARAVAFYPGCRAMAERGTFGSGMPLLILVGDIDDWTGAEPCRALAAQARAKGGSSVEVVAYPGAHHDFDHPDMPLRTRRGLAYTTSGTGEAHAGTNPTARADALERVPAFLSK